MRARPGRRGWARTFAAPAALAMLVAASGCGGGGGGGASKADYYKAADRFCGKVTVAARRVSTESAAVRSDTGATATAKLNRITAALTSFADAAEAALKDLEKADAPSEFASFQKGTASGFRRYVATLRATAHDAAKDPTVLTKLESRLGAVKLPDPPKAVAANAKACASFSPPAG